jgi:hypothetical protein
LRNIAAATLAVATAVARATTTLNACRAIEFITGKS